MQLLRAINQIKLHPLTADAYSDQWILLTVTATMSVTDNAQILSLAYYSIFLVFNSY